jgi:hypothetical protein
LAWLDQLSKWHFHLKDSSIMSVCSTSRTRKLIQKCNNSQINMHKQLPSATYEITFIIVQQTHFLRNFDFSLYLHWQSINLSYKAYIEYSLKGKLRVSHMNFKHIFEISVFYEGGKVKLNEMYNRHWSTNVGSVHQSDQNCQEILNMKNHPTLRITGFLDFVNHLEF